MKTIEELLRNNAYPGRGILLGVDEKGACTIAYFIMGRSENSRNRIFTETESGIITQAADPTKVIDPSLIIYAPVRVSRMAYVVTNGDQTDTICNEILYGGTFESALRKRTFEPDAPNWTPRISGIISLQNGFPYRLCILKSTGGQDPSVERFFYEYPQPKAGKGHFLSTYLHDGNPLPSFAGDPIAVALPAVDIDTFGETIWNALHEENRISLFVRQIYEGNTESRIYNRYTAVTR